MMPIRDAEDWPSRKWHWRATLPFASMFCRLIRAKKDLTFTFLGLSEAHQFSNYLAQVAPLKIKTTKKLVSTDVKSNTANMKYTVACDMVPLCRDDLVLVHKSAKGKLAGRLALVTKMSSVVHLADASPRRDRTSMAEFVGEVAPETSWQIVLVGHWRGRPTWTW